MPDRLLPLWQWTSTLWPAWISRTMVSTRMFMICTSGSWGWSSIGQKM